MGINCSPFLLTQHLFYKPPLCPLDSCLPPLCPLTRVLLRVGIVQALFLVKLFCTSIAFVYCLEPNYSFERETLMPPATLHSGTGFFRSVFLMPSHTPNVMSSRRQLRERVHVNDDGNHHGSRLTNKVGVAFPLARYFSRLNPKRCRGGG